MQYSEIMVRYGELSTKGKNRMRFINKLKRNIQAVLSVYPQVHVKADRDRTHIYLQGTDYQPVAESLKQIFGIQNFSPSYGVKKSVPALIEAVQNWEEKHHSYRFEKDVLVFIEGVVPAISTAIQAFTKEGEAVLINTPVYPPFARSIKLNNRRLITNSLVEKDGLFEIDFEQLEKDFTDLEKQIKDGIQKKLDEDKELANEFKQWESLI